MAVDDAQPESVVTLSITHGKNKRVDETRNHDHADGARQQEVAGDAQGAVGGLAGQQGEVGLMVFVVE